MIPFPNKKYDVIYADPPWDVSFIKRESRPNQKCLPYKTMSLKDIKNLPIQDISEENSVLFLWTTHKFLPKSFEVMKSWGFKYQRTITWDKQNGFCFFGFHQRTEFLLFGYKGKIKLYKKGKAFPTIVSAKSARHSGKPDIFRRMISSYGFGEKYIELFARCKPEGWDVWGDEVDNEIIIPKIYKKGKFFD